MRNCTNTVLLFALASATASGTPIWAQAGATQEDPQVLHHRNACRLAHQILVHGQPANKRIWAIGYANGCGDLGGDALAAAVLQYQSGRVPDGEMEKLVESAALLVDARIFEAALSLAAHSNAVATNRVQAIRIAFQQLNPTRFESYETFIVDPLRTTTIYSPLVTSEAPPVGVPIPAEGLHRAAHIAGVILADTAAPDSLRRAASYLLVNVQRQQARARLCVTGITAQQCSRLMDEWDAQQERLNTHSKVKRSLVIATVALLGIGARPAVAQEYRQKREGEDVHLRNDCRLAVQVLMHGHPANKRDWALWRISGCDESGPPVLAHMWRQVPADSASLGKAVRYSVRLRDRRVYDVLSSIARDRSVPALKRAAALHLLGRWAQQGLNLHYRQFFVPGFESVERNGVIHQGISDDTQYEGAEPLPATIKADVQRLARNVAATDPSYRLRAAANLLASSLSH